MNISSMREMAFQCIYSLEVQKQKMSEDYIDLFKSDTVIAISAYFIFISLLKYNLNNVDIFISWKYIHIYQYA